MNRPHLAYYSSIVRGRCRNARFTCVAIALVTTAACGIGTPSTETAAQALKSSIDKGSEARLRLTSIHKTDGRAMEFMGMKAYELMFTGEAEFLSNAMYSSGSPLLSEGSQIATSEYKEPAPGFSWNDFLSSSQGFRPAMKGDSLHLAGSVTYERRESGWIPVGVTFRVVHDETTRDMEAIRIEAEKKRAEEAKKRQLERERLEQIAREQAARDARAERLVALVEGDGFTKDGYGRRVEAGYFIGRMTGNDVLLIEPLRGRYTNISIYSGEGSRYDFFGRLRKDRIAHSPGQLMRPGEWGGTGKSWNTSGPLRLGGQEHLGLRNTAGDATLMYLMFDGSDDVELRATVLCIQGDDNPPCRDR